MTEHGIRNITVGGDVLQSVLVTGDRVQVTVGAAGPGREAEPPAFRILTCIARPLDSQELPDIAEARALADGLARVRAPVYLGFVRPPTPDALRTRLQEGWDVFHFDGHGTAENGGALLLEDEDGLGVPLPASDLADLLRQCRVPKLLILSACQSAKALPPPAPSPSPAPGERGRDRPEGPGMGVRTSLAGHLLQATGARAVIGFTETVSIETTRAFLLPFYAALGAGRTIRQAFEAARAALPEAARRLPVLLGDGVDEPLAPPGRRGAPEIERLPLHGVPAPAEFRFYGDFLPGDPPEGRRGLLHRIVRALRRGERFVVLCGAGGIGKSALAALAAERLTGPFPGGVFWTDGAAYLDRGLDPDAALEPFAAVLGTDFLKLSRTAKRQEVQALARRLEAPFLWILDNADVADDEVWRLARELPAPSAVLLTTRERPERGGRLFPVGPLTPTEAARLLWTEAVRRGWENPPLPTDTAAMRPLAEIAALLEGHPLALLIAAALVADIGPQEALAAVRANPARGETARRFDFSYNRLPEPERALLRRLTPFAGDFGIEAVEGVVALTPTPGGEAATPSPSPTGERGRVQGEGVRALLLSLSRRSFLTPTPGGEAATPSPSPAERERGRGQGEGVRYRLHPVLRAYLRAKTPDAEYAESVRALVGYYLPRTQEAYEALGDPEKALAAVAWAAAEGVNLLGAQAAALEQGMGEEAVAFAYALNELFERTGRWDLRRQALENGRSAAPAGSRDFAALTHNLGILAQDQGDYPEARRLYEESLRLREQLGDRAGVAQTLHNLGALAQAQGDYPEARRLYEESLRIKEQLGDRAGVAQTLHNLGALAQAQGDYPEARRLYEQSLRIKEQLGDRAGVAQTLHNLGALAHAQGDYPEARRLYEESLRLREQLGDRAGVAQTLHQLGILAQDQGDYPQARRLYEQAAEAFRDLGARREQAAVLHQLGMLAQAQGDYPEARRLYEESLRLREQLGDRAGVAQTLHQLGILAHAQGDYPQARRLYEQSLRIKEQLGDRAGVAITLHQLGNLAYLQGDYPEARRLYEESLRLREQLGDRAGVAQTLHNLGALAQAQGDYPEARRLYEQAAEHFRELGALREQAAVLHNLGALAQDQGDYPEARRLYEESLRLREQLGDRAGVAQTLHNLGALAQAQSDYPEARRLYEESLRIAEQLGSRAGVAITMHQLGMLAQAQGDYPQARRLYEESLRIAEQLGNRAGVAITTAQLALLEEAEGNLPRALELITRAEAAFAQLGSPYREQARRVRERIRARLGGG